MRPTLVAISLVLLLAAPLPAAQHFLTTTFPATVGDDAIRFDLSDLPPDTRVFRAVLRMSDKGHPSGAAVRLVPAGQPDAARLKLRPPDYVSFDATAAVQAWVADPQADRGIRIEDRGGLDFRGAVLEVSHPARPPSPSRPSRAVPSTSPARRSSPGRRSRIPSAPTLPPSATSRRRSSRPGRSGASSTASTGTPSPSPWRLSAGPNLPARCPRSSPAGT